MELPEGQMHVGYVKTGLKIVKYVVSRVNNYVVVCQIWFVFSRIHTTGTQKFKTYLTLHNFKFYQQNYKTMDCIKHFVII